MDVSQYAKYFDHTLLKANAKQAEIVTLTEEALEYGFFGVCVNSSFIPLVAKLTEGSDVKPLAVVGFPLGAMATEAKAFETSWSIDHGAQEIDMVIAIGRLLDPEQHHLAKQDIAAVVKAAGKVPVKVIIETAYLQESDIRRATHWCVDAGAAFVKTSTGFAPRGAAVSDILTIRDEISKRGATETVQMKASGGIKTAKDFRTYLDLGVMRIGTSSGISIIRELSGEAFSKDDTAAY